MTHLPSRLCLSDIRHSVPCKNRASTILAALPRCAASYPLPVRQASAWPSASSRFPVAQNTLAVRLTLPLVGRGEDFHLPVSAPCRAHQILKGAKTAIFAPRPPGAQTLPAILQLALITELKIAEPEVCLFVTGPDYDRIIGQYYPGIEFQPIHAPVREFAQLVHRDLPEKSYRCYHPKYLRLGGHWDQTMDILRQELQWA